MRCVTLLFLFLLALSLTAQVGVNNTTPEQALDVNGKIKLTDDATAPSAGTLRYNDADGDFEGYNGSEWKSLTTAGAGPSNPVAYHGRTTGVAQGNTADVTFTPWESGSTFTVVPAGKYFLVTSLEYHANGLGNDDLLIKAFIYVRTSSNGIVTSLTFDGPASSLTPRIASRDNPLVILRPGDRLQLNHVITSDKNFIELRARGFLVDDLDF